jgi:hypothetical protein
MPTTCEEKDTGFVIPLVNFADHEGFPLPPSTPERRSMHASLARLSLRTAALLASLLAPALARAAEPQVLAVAAIDGYADLKKQLAWLGSQIGQPTLAIAADSMLMMATQGRGVNGLDTQRPMGVVVTTDGTQPIVHGYIPVKSLDKLLESLQASIGVAEKDGDVRRVTMPSGATVEFVERAAPSGTWAVAGLPGGPAGMADPLPVLEPVAKQLSIGLRVFPSLMPDALRKQLEILLDQAARQAAAQGQPIDPGTAQQFLAGLADTESLSLGLAIDATANQIFVESDVINVAGSPAAKRIAAAGKAALTVGLPPSADGRRAAIQGHVAQVIPADVQPQIVQSLDASLADADQADEPLTKTVGAIARSLLTAMLGTGSMEAAVAVDTSVATAAAPLPAVTAGVRVKDGKALEAQLKKALGDGGSLPGAKVTFDAGTAGGATLHTVRLAIDDDEVAKRFGDAVELTLAVAPQYAFVLVGGNVKARAAAAVAASGKPVADAKPIADLRAGMEELLTYAKSVDVDDEEEAERGAAAARAAGKADATLEVRPVERGTATRLVIDAGVLKAIAAMRAPPQAAAPGLPAGVPLPQGFPIPVPVR